MFTLDDLTSAPSCDPSNQLEMFRVMLDQFADHLNASGYIRPGIIEIYNQDSVQEASGSAFEIGSKMLSGGIAQTVLNYANVHEVEEVFSQGKTKARVEEVLLSPLPRVGGEVGGFLHVFRAVR